MLRDRYHHELQELESRMLDLGRTVASAVYEAVDALVRGDAKRSESIIARDEDVNRERVEIQSRVLTLIATQQPVAGEIRLLAAVLESVAEIERIGDYAKGIASIALAVRGETLPPAVLYMLLEMAELARSMMRSSLDAFQMRDTQGAARIMPEDDAVDELYKEVFRTVLAECSGEMGSLELANYMVWVAHNLERTADRVTNICESTIYVVSGELVSSGSSALGGVLESLGRGPAPSSGDPSAAGDPVEPSSTPDADAPAT